MRRIINKKILTVVAWLSATTPNLVKAQEIFVKDRAQEQISQILENDWQTTWENTFSEEEVQNKLYIEEQIEDKILELKKDKVVKDMIDFYGEDWFKAKIKEMIRIIADSPDDFGSFDSVGNFSLTKKGKVQKLYELMFDDYLYSRGEEKYKKTMPLVVWGLMALLWLMVFYWYKE